MYYVASVCMPDLFVYSSTLPPLLAYHHLCYANDFCVYDLSLCTFAPDVFCLWVILCQLSQPVNPPSQIFLKFNKQIELFMLIKKKH